MEMTIVRGSLPDWATGYGYGYGYGYGSGSGDGYGSGDGDGSGYGYGSGDGDGYGSGYGSGDGSGYGYGSGDGDGYGSGDGDGYGYGSGYGSGDGYGDGSGYGYGSGDGSPDYWRACIKYFAAKWPEIQQSRMQDLAAAGATIAYWRSDSEGRACNGGRNAPVSPGTVERIEGPLEICTRRALHATLIPPKWNGERWWIVALIGEVQGDDEKFGALTREVLGEAI